MDLKFITLFVFVAALYSLGCNSDEIDLPRFQNKYYYVNNSYTTWFASWKVCNDRNMKLLSVQSREESIFLRQYLLKISGSTGYWFWTSGTKCAANGGYYWAGSNLFLNTNEFKKGYPTNNTYADYIVFEMSTSEKLEWMNWTYNTVAIAICERTVDFP